MRMTRLAPNGLLCHTPPWNHERLRLNSGSLQGILGDCHVVLVSERLIPHNYSSTTSCMKDLGATHAP